MRMLSEAVDALLAGRPARVPRFDKASDDRAGVGAVTGPVEVILLEGWCVGARAQPDAALAQPINRLERDEDPDGHWRRWVNARLAGDYAALFARLDLRLFLRAPDFAVVAGWRAEQERDRAAPGMDDAQIARFVAHYERIIRAMLSHGAADLTIDLDARRVPLAIVQ